MLKLPRPERNGKHFVSYCNKRNKSDNDYSIAQAVFRHMGDIRRFRRSSWQPRATSPRHRPAGSSGGAALRRSGSSRPRW